MRIRKYLFSTRSTPPFSLISKRAPRVLRREQFVTTQQHPTTTSHNIAQHLSQTALLQSNFYRSVISHPCSLSISLLQDVVARYGNCTVPMPLIDPADSSIIAYVDSRYVLEDDSMFYCRESFNLIAIQPRWHREHRQSCHLQHQRRQRLGYHRRLLCTYPLLLSISNIFLAAYVSHDNGLLWMIS